MGFIPGVFHGSNPPSVEVIVFPEMLENFVGIDTILAATEGFVSAPLAAFVGIVLVSELLELTFNEYSDWHLTDYV